MSLAIGDAAEKPECGVTLSVTQQPIKFSWLPAERARIYLVQPTEDGLTSAAPCTHPPNANGCPWPSLKAAIAADIAQPWDGPVVFVVPELTVDPAFLPELQELWTKLPANRLLVAGLGHLTASQCDAVEAGVGSTKELWERPDAPGLFANCALVLPGPFLEAKNSPSKFEREMGCHRPHARLRVFQGQSFAFAVLICSDMNDIEARNDVLTKLNPYSLDAVFWLEHNPSPRHEYFHPLVEGLLDRHSKALIVCANKAPSRGRRTGYYGASGFVLRADRMESDKRSLARINLAVEGVSDAVTRAVLPQYAAAVHCVDTIRPAAVDRASGDAAAGRLLAAVVPYDVNEGVLSQRADGQHIIELIEAGEATAAARARLPHEAVTSASHRRQVIIEKFGKTANELMLFLDHAMRRNQPGRYHETGQPHSPAAACRCWTHRENFDSLFTPERCTAVSELVLALAVLPGATPSFARRTNVSLTVGGRPRQLLLAWGEDKASDVFEREYWGPTREDLIPKPAVILDCRARVLAGVDASRPPPKERDAANTVDPEPRRLYGEQFWEPVRKNGVEAALEGIFP